MSQWSKDPPNTGMESFKSSQRGHTPPWFTHQFIQWKTSSPSGTLRASSTRRSTDRIDALGGNYSGLGVHSGAAGAVAGAILAVDGRGPGRGVPPVAGTDGSRPRSPVHIQGGPEPCCRYRPRAPPLPRAFPLAPLSALPKLALGAQTGWAWLGLSPRAEVAIPVPGDAGLEAWWWGGTRWHCLARAHLGPAWSVASLFCFALSQGFFAKGRNLRPSSSLEMAHVSHC